MQKNEEARMKNVIIYCRVSSDEQKENTSIEFQEKVLRAYCNNHHYTVLNCYHEDFTAKDYYLRRPEMKAIYQYCKKHKNEVDLLLKVLDEKIVRCEVVCKYMGNVKYDDVKNILDNFRVLPWDEVNKPAEDDEEADETSDESDGENEKTGGDKGSKKINKKDGKKKDVKKAEGKESKKDSNKKKN